MGRKRTGIESTCGWCGKAYYRPGCQVKRTAATACSHACRGHLRRDGEHKVCEHCGNSFYLPKGKAKSHPGRFCSNACNGAAFKQTVTVPCSWCKAPLERNLYKIKRLKRHFCNLTCTHEWKARFGTEKGRGAFTTKQKREWMGNCCVKCGSTEELQLDHIIPRFAGGSNTKENAQTLCRICNKNKYWLSDQFLFTPDLPNSTRPTSV